MVGDSDISGWWRPTRGEPFRRARRSVELQPARLVYRAGVTCLSFSFHCKRTFEKVQESCRSTAKERHKESETILEDVYHAAGQYQDDGRTAEVYWWQSSVLYNSSITTQPLWRVAVKLCGSKLASQKGLSSLTRIPLDLANVDVFSDSTKFVHQIDFVNSDYEFLQ